MRLFAFYFLEYIRRMVQGENMEKRKKKTGIGKLPAMKLYMTGFFAGIFITNFIWKMEWRQKTLASIYLLGTFAGKEMEGTEYFLYVLKMRGSVFLIAALCGISVFGVPLAVMGSLVQGMKIGILWTMSILQFGMVGGLVSAGLLIPQYILYIPSMCYLFSLMFAQSMEMWRNKGVFPKKISWYFSQVLFTGMLYFVGIVLEAYGNPWFFQMLTKNLHLF